MSFVLPSTIIMLLGTGFRFMMVAAVGSRISASMEVVILMAHMEPVLSVRSEVEYNIFTEAEPSVSMFTESPFRLKSRKTPSPSVIIRFS